MRVLINRLACSGQAAALTASCQQRCHASQQLSTSSLKMRLQKTSQQNQTEVPTQLLLALSTVQLPYPVTNKNSHTAAPHGATYSLTSYDKKNSHAAARPGATDSRHQPGQGSGPAVEPQETTAWALALALPVQGRNKLPHAARLLVARHCVRHCDDQLLFGSLAIRDNKHLYVRLAGAIGSVQPAEHSSAHLARQTARGC